MYNHPSCIQRYRKNADCKQRLQKNADNMQRLENIADNMKRLANNAEYAEIGKQLMTVRNDWQKILTLYID